LFSSAHASDKMSFTSTNRDFINKQTSQYSQNKTSRQRMTTLLEEDPEVKSISTLMGRLSISNKSMEDY